MLLPRRCRPSTAFHSITSIASLRLVAIFLGNVSMNDNDKGLEYFSSHICRKRTRS